MIDAIGAEVTGEVRARRARSRSGLVRVTPAVTFPPVFAEREAAAASRAFHVH
ncbi:hypothetical protein [Mycolicibacterium sp. P9-64]|uniref:hypothetical protein n=1 Tax=Mycolicibacterium sp. P9-64 TaxID=2024612 RepID=UPI00156633E9|nr:hypothetical protein [Mycolicibacterium sp. P9-64]